MDNRLEVLNVRTRGIGRTQPVTLPELARGDGDPSAARLADREAFDFGTRSMVAFATYDRSLLRAGDTLAGPALIDEGTSTTVVHSGQQVTVNPFGHLLITAGGAA